MDIRKWLCNDGCAKRKTYVATLWNQWKRHIGGDESGDVEMVTKDKGL